MRLATASMLAPHPRRPMLLTPMLVVAGVAMLTGAALAQDGPGDVVAGRRLAETWCAACHQIDRRELLTRSYRGAPAFPHIADLPSTTALSLNVFLRTTHDGMPNYHISGQDADDVITYLLSLKSK